MSLLEKPAVVLVIIVGCFAVLYPKLFHPMLKTVFGLTSKDETSKGGQAGKPFHHQTPESMMGDSSSHGNMPPPLRMGKTGGGHPGFRSAQELRAQALNQQNTSKPINLLPMYSIGILIFLLYTLMKIFTKGDRIGEQNEEHMKQYYKNLQWDTDSNEFRFGAENDDSIDNYLGDRMHEKPSHARDAEEDTGEESAELGKEDLENMEDQLEQTEAYMAQIMEQVDAVSRRLNPDILEKKKATPEEQKEELRDRLSELMTQVSLMQKQLTTDSVSTKMTRSHLNSKPQAQTETALHRRAFDEPCDVGTHIESETDSDNPESSEHAKDNADSDSEGFHPSLTDEENDTIQEVDEEEEEEDDEDHNIDCEPSDAVRKRLLQTSDHCREHES